MTICYNAGMKFICDQMLGKLGRWLRTAGYDTVIIQDSTPDSEILQRALVENRTVLTRDKDFAGKEGALYLSGEQLEECVAELTQKLKIDWLHAPFTRCLECNTLLEIEGNSTYCPKCAKHYWEGSHTGRMRKTLTEWNAD